MHMSKAKNHDEIVHFVQVDSIAAQIESVYQKVHDKIHSLTPSANIKHIGSTSIPDSLSKGDLDVLVLVNSANFKEAEKILNSHFQQNTGTQATPYFHSYTANDYAIEIGIQLKSKESKWPCFLQWQKRLLEDAIVRNEYDDLKRNFEGKLMQEYRDAKERLIEKYYPSV